MSERYQNGSLMKLKRKNGSVVWTFRWYENVAGKRTYRKKVLGTLAGYPLRKDAEKLAAPLRSTINSKVIVPQTVNDLITHYFQHELTTDNKAFSTVEVNGNFIRLYVGPKWGRESLAAVRTVAVEQWLKSLPLAPASRSKVKAVFSALYAHAIRYEWLHQNPIKAVRCSAKRLRKKDILTPEEFVALMDELSIREGVMVMLAGSTGLRRSEFIGLLWSDLNVEQMMISVTRSCFRNHIGETKTEASKAPVPLHPRVLEHLLLWREQSLYKEDRDFIFPSLRLSGKKPLSPDTVLTRIIRPALLRAGIKDKVIGWHSFRHALSTLLIGMGADVKVVQELMRHANSRITLDLYAQAISKQKRIANDKVVELLLPKGGKNAA